jgi:hypothetical protein
MKVFDFNEDGITEIGVKQKQDKSRNQRSIHYFNKSDHCSKSISYKNINGKR